MIHIGISRQDLFSALPGNRQMSEERIEAITLCIRDPHSGKTGLWTVLDFMDFDFHTVNTLKEAIRARTFLPMENIHIVTTHNHGGGEPDLTVLSDLCALCASNALSDARPALIRYIETTVDKQVSILRRKYVPELESSITLFYGCSDKDRYDSAPFAEHAIRTTKEGRLSYVGRTDTERPFDPFLSGDPGLTAVQFQAPDGTPIGTVIRFAAHVTCANTADCYTSDYPWHIRSKMESLYGGTALFFNGPCGDIAPGVASKTDNTQKILGTYLADLAAGALQDRPFEPLTCFADATAEIPLPAREEVLEGSTSLPPTSPAALPQLRRYLEKEYLNKFIPFLREKADENGRIPETLTVSLGFLRLNNLFITAFPGETFSSTAKELKDAFPGLTLCSVTEHDRTVMYLPPTEEFRLGGYESVCMTTAAGSEEILRKESIRALRSFLAESSAC